MLIRALALVAAALTGAAGGLRAQPAFPLVPASPKALPSTVANGYREDAARLAVRHLTRVTPALERSPELPSALVETLFNALARVYASDAPARDAVVDRHRIHTFENPPLHEVIVAVNPQAPWADAWQRGARLTGDAAVDALVREHELTVSTPALVLRSPRPLDIEALAARFARIPGVRYAEPNGLAGDGDDIQATVADAAWRLEYSKGWGDCPAGCTGRHVWSFRVGSDGAVTFLGSRGPAPPAIGVADQDGQEHPRTSDRSQSRRAQIWATRTASACGSGTSVAWVCAGGSTNTPHVAERRSNASGPRHADRGLCRGAYGLPLRERAGTGSQARPARCPVHPVRSPPRHLVRQPAHAAHGRARSLQGGRAGGQAA